MLVNVLENTTTKGKFDDKFKIGDVVVFNYDIKKEKPFSVLNIKKNSITIVRVNVNNNITRLTIKSPDSLIVCNDFKMQFEKLDILKSENIFGLIEYGSIIKSNLESEKANKIAKDSRWVYDFKKYNRKQNDINIFSRAIAFYFDCSDIVAIPSHDANVNNLQNLFGTHIKRIKTVDKRKYNHTKPLQENYDKTFKIDISKIKGKHILLIDDVATSGTTINYFKEIFISLGFKVTCFVLGISKKLEPKFFNKIVIKL